MRGAGALRCFGACVALLSAALSSGLGCATAHAAVQIEALKRPYPYLVVDQDLRIVLSEFGRNLGIEIEVSRDVVGVARGLRGVDSADEFLRRLAQAHDLVWYIDRNTLFVSTRKENGTEVLAVPSMQTQQRQALVDEWSRQGTGIGIVPEDRTSSLLVTGPVSFRERIAAVVKRRQGASSPDKAAIPSRGETEITVYRGNAGSQRVMVSR